jgi:TonB family protein
MSLQWMREDLQRIRRNEKRMLLVSIVAHALLLLFLVRFGPADAGGDEITEVALLEPGDTFEPSAPAAGQPAPAQPAPVTQAGVLKSHAAEERFRRAPDPGETAPKPQADDVFVDRLNERLATLQSATTQPVVGLANVTPPKTPLFASPATVASPTATDGAAIELRRGGKEGGGGQALALNRGAGGGSGSGLALAALPAEKAASRPAAAPRDIGTRQSLAGVSLAGPIADRAVLDAVRPTYPQWAKSEGVEGSVTLYFVVLPDGSVKENVLVQKTAGFSDFDDGAVEAVRRWRFVPLAPGRTGDQWGTITFRYRLADAR